MRNAETTPHSLAQACEKPSRRSWHYWHCELHICSHARARTRTAASPTDSLLRTHKSKPPFVSSFSVDERQSFCLYVAYSRLHRFLRVAKDIGIMEFVSMRRMVAVLLFVGMATMLASSAEGAEDPFKYCNFFLNGFEDKIPTLIVCPTGDVAYSKFKGHIMHRIVPDPSDPSVFTDEEVLTANSNGCYMSKDEGGPWNKTMCAEKFTTIQQWVHKRNLQDDAPWFLKKFIKIGISSAQYSWGNSKSSPKDCLMIKTADKFAKPGDPDCQP